MYLDESIESPPSIKEFHLEPRCRVCRDDEVRTKVNDLLATGSSYAMVLRALDEDNARLDQCDRVTIDSIRNHCVRHFPVQNVARATYREIVERRAREAQIDFVNGVATALTPIALYECVMNEAFRRLVDGNVDVSADTGLRAAEKLRAIMREDEDGFDRAKMLAEYGRFVEAARTFIPEENWPAFQAALRGERVPQQSKPLAARMVQIDDSPDQDGN
jgi:hypothetical protein